VVLVQTCGRSRGRRGPGPVIRENISRRLRISYSTTGRGRMGAEAVPAGPEPPISGPGLGELGNGDQGCGGRIRSRERQYGGLARTQGWRPPVSHRRRDYCGPQRSGPSLSSTIHAGVVWRRKKTPYTSMPPGLDRGILELVDPKPARISSVCFLGPQARDC